MRYYSAYDNSTIDWHDILRQVQAAHLGGAGDRDTWTGLAASLQAAGGDDVHLQIFLEISRNSDNYKGDRDCLQVWNSYRHVRAYTAGTVIKFLHDAGIRITHEDNNAAPRTHYTPRPTTAAPAPPPPLPAGEYYTETEKQYQATTSAAARNASRLMHWLRLMLWGSADYYAINEVWQAYRCGYDADTWHEFFRYYDSTGQLTKIKCMIYRDDGHREHGDDDGRLNGRKVQFYLSPGAGKIMPAFFGEHLLTERPGDPVGIVESEKSALIMAIFNPAVIWLASGGANYLNGLAGKQVLTGRRVILYPDLDQVDKWTAIGRRHGWTMAPDVLPWLIDALREIGPKSDIADYTMQELITDPNCPALINARAFVMDHPDAWRLMQLIPCEVVTDQQKIDALAWPVETCTSGGKRDDTTTTTDKQQKDDDQHRDTTSD